MKKVNKAKTVTSNNTLFCIIINNNNNKYFINNKNIFMVIDWYTSKLSRRQKISTRKTNLFETKYFKKAKWFYNYVYDF